MDRRPEPIGRPVAALVAGGARAVQAAIPVAAVLLLRDLPFQPVPPAGWLLGAALALAASAACATVALATRALARGEPITVLVTAGVAALAGPAVYLALAGPAAARTSLAVGAAAAGALVFGAALLPHLVSGGVPALRLPRLLLVVAIALPAEAALALAAGLGPLEAPAVAWLWGAAALGLAAGSLLLGVSSDPRRAVPPSALALLAGAGAAQALAGPGAVATVVADASVALALAGLALGAARTQSVPGSRTQPLPWPMRALPDGALVFDPALRLVDWNAAAERVLGPLEPGALPEQVFGPALARPRRFLEHQPDGTRQASLGPQPVRPGGGQIEVLLVDAGNTAQEGEPGSLLALVRDLAPDAQEETVRLTRELRGTIEELLAARHTIDLQREELERAAQLDPLTRLASRAAILSRLSSEVAEARRYSHPVAVLRLDLDGFGAVNLAHGREAADRLLAEVALRLRLRTRAADAVGRTGGDDFLMVLPHTDEEGAARLAEVVRRRLAEAEVETAAGSVRCTTSIGIGLMRPGEELDVDELLARADEALDLARTGGGDRVEIDHLHSLRRLEQRRAGGRAGELGSDRAPGA